MVGVQILLLAALLLVLARRVPALQLAQELLAWVVERLGRLGLDRLRGRAGRLGPPLRWALVARTQAFGVAFNAAALLTAYALITFSDRQFAWSTTLRSPEGVFFDVLHALAAPWRPFVPAASPSLDDLLHSRYFMMESRYQYPDLGPEAARSWWPFLLMAVAVYGLLPRVLALGFALWRQRAALAEIPLRGDAEYSRILERLELDVPEFVADPDRSTSEAPASPGPRAALPNRGGSCVLVAWDGAELDAEAVESRFGWRVARRFRPDEAPAKDVDGPVVLAPPAWEDPTKSYQRVIRAWRRSTGPDRLLVVLLARPERRRIWESVLAGMADPSLRVEALG
jgi:hypothetical protein